MPRRNSSASYSQPLSEPPSMVTRRQGRNSVFSPLHLTVPGIGRWRFGLAQFVSISTVASLYLVAREPSNLQALSFVFSLFGRSHLTSIQPPLPVLPNTQLSRIFGLSDRMASRLLIAKRCSSSVAEIFLGCLIESMSIIM